MKRRMNLRTHRTWIAVALLVCAMPVASALAGAEPRVDLNSATVEQLEALPGIGPAKAAAIVEARSTQRFASVGDLERVKGIGPALVAELEDRVSVAAPKKSQP